MNYKYKKKPVVIEAFQMTRDRRTDNSEWPNWLHSAWQREPKTEGSLYPTIESGNTCPLSIGTLEGQHFVTWDDWIIQGVDGEIYPCKPGIFDKTYEKATP